MEDGTSEPGDREGDSRTQYWQGLGPHPGMAGGVQVRSDGWIPAGPIVREGTSSRPGGVLDAEEAREKSGASSGRHPARDSGRRGSLELTGADGISSRERVGRSGRQAPRPRVG